MPAHWFPFLSSADSPAPDSRDELTELVGAKIAAGTLRQDECSGGIVVSLGSQQSCHACDRSISVDDVEMRSTHGDGGHMRLHARCFAVWHEHTHRRPRS